LGTTGTTERTFWFPIIVDNYPLGIFSAKRYMRMMLDIASLQQISYFVEYLNNLNKLNKLNYLNNSNNLNSPTTSAQQPQLNNPNNLSPTTSTQ
jgi:hypothetical protein